MSASELPGGLRERKKRQTRAAILATADGLFEARGYEHVTVAEIADTANVSVKTLFTYFRSKEDLAFADEHELRDQLTDAIRTRPAGSTPVEAVAALLDRLVVDGGSTGLEGFHRGYGGSDALQSRLRRMWENYEDALTAVLAEELVLGGKPPDAAASPETPSLDPVAQGPGPRADAAAPSAERGPGVGGAGAAPPEARLVATMLVGLVRSVASPEVLAEVTGHPSAQARREELRAWIATGAAMAGGLDRFFGRVRS